MGKTGMSYRQKGNEQVKNRGDGYWDGMWGE